MSNTIDNLDFFGCFLIGKIDLTRLPSQTISSRWQVDKEAIGLSRVQQFSHLCVTRPYQISVNSIFEHIHTISINTTIWQFRLEEDRNVSAI